MQKSDHLKTKLAAAKIKTQQALAAVEVLIIQLLSTHYSLLCRLPRHRRSRASKLHNCPNPLHLLSRSHRSLAISHIYIARLQAEYNKAKAELASVSKKGDAPASYASTIKNIEAKLLKSQTDVETANRDKVTLAHYWLTTSSLLAQDKLSQELSDVKGRVMNEKDMIEKDKLKKKEQALEGQVL